MELKIASNDKVSSLNAQRALHRHSPTTEVQSQTRSGTFLEALKQARKDANVTFSKHAEQRMNTWNEHKTHNYIEELDNAMDIAQAKGARSTLVLMKGVAFLVAPQTRTVVTVIPEDRMKDNLFTSIDSAVLMDE